MQEVKLPIGEAIGRVKEWALSNGFEERRGVGFCRRLPFGFAYLDFKGEELEMTITAVGLDKGHLMASERQPLWLSLHCDLGDWLLHWLKCMLYKYVDAILE
jgi:hypothetical protein